MINKKVLEEINALRKSYEEALSKDYKEETDALDGQSIEEGNTLLKTYIRQKTNRMLKEAQRYALDNLYPVSASEKRRKSSKKAIRKGEEYALLCHEYFKMNPSFNNLENVSYPTDLSKEDLEEFHTLFITKKQKKESDAIIWNSQYVMEEAASFIDVKTLIVTHYAGMQKSLRKCIEEYFLTIDVHEFYICKKKQRIRVRVDDDSFELFAKSFTDSSKDGRGLFEDYAWDAASCQDAASFIMEYLKREDSEIRALTEAVGGLDAFGSFSDAFTDRVASALISGSAWVYKNVLFDFDEEEIERLLSQNEHYAWIIAKRYEERERQKRLRLGLLDMIPDTYPELFPLARAMERHFVLHVGPTNSGKSHDSIEALKQASNGIYLAPLRLLAYEKYEEFNEDGVPCSMITGEETIEMPESTVKSCTIEILDFTTIYDIAVIDEGQMLSDSQRGSAWTMAILGIRCPLVHICLAPEAEEIIKGIIESCGDTYETVRHERLVPLTYKKETKDIFPRNSERGDAFIVFSRRDVHACAAELADNGVKCSMIYGNLPYDVRRQEVKRYESGETDVVVATDAIGMGLNLPIKRIVFLRTSKFDGVEKRPLYPSEVKQIAGRAGRYRIFDEGIVSADLDKKLIGTMLNKETKSIEKAVIGFPYSLVDVPGSLSYLLNEWSNMTPLKGFEMADMSDQISLAAELEKHSTDKELIFRFVMIPFDVGNNVLHALWLSLFLCENQKKKADIDGLIILHSSGEELSELEEDFKACDILYHYAKDFLHDEERTLRIMHAKNEISSKIMEILSKEAPEHRTCRYCGRKLPFQYQYNMCEKCFKKRKHMRY